MRGAALPLLAACSVLALLCQTRAAEHYNAASCDKACTAGRCHFKDCERPTTCNGGLCLFENCVRPACNGTARRRAARAKDEALTLATRPASHFPAPGGACTFVQCKHPSCNGGSYVAARPAPSARRRGATLPLLTLPPMPLPSPACSQLQARGPQDGPRGRLLRRRELHRERQAVAEQVPPAPERVGAGLRGRGGKGVRDGRGAVARGAGRKEEGERSQPGKRTPLF